MKKIRIKFVEDGFSYSTWDFSPYFVIQVKKVWWTDTAYRFSDRDKALDFAQSFVASGLYALVL